MDGIDNTASNNSPIVVCIAIATVLVIYLAITMQQTMYMSHFSLF
jgi:hypothetical protein